MFDPRKTDNFPGDPGAVTKILAALIALLVLGQFLMYGSAIKVIGGIIFLFGIWWVYYKFFRGKTSDDMSKYRQALLQQKRKKSAGKPDKGKVIYLDGHKRKHS